MTQRILHVDDTPSALYARTRLLQRSGYEVVEAASGREALARLDGGEAALMLIDVNLPDMSGMEVCQRVKSDPSTREMPVVQISAVRTSDFDAARGVSSGADFYVTEPVRPESLLLVIKALLERRQLQREVQQATVRQLLDSAREARRAQQDMLATLGHELRDPLHAMTAWLGALREPGLPEEERSKAVGRIQRAVQLQRGIVEDLLDIARIRGGRLALAPEPMSLEHAVMTAIDDMQDAIVDKNIRMCVRSDGPVWIRADAVRIGQVIRNLLANAIKFTAVGGHVDVACRRVGSDAELSIADDGAGIAAELLPHVFESYTQAERVGSEPHAGLGLGLAIASHIVREHRGHISVESAGPGAGATFTVRFPAIPPR